MAMSRVEGHRLGDAVKQWAVNNKLSWTPVYIVDKRPDASPTKTWMRQNLRKRSCLMAWGAILEDDQDAMLFFLTWG